MVGGPESPDVGRLLSSYRRCARHVFPGITKLGGARPFAAALDPDNLADSECAAMWRRRLGVGHRMTPRLREAVSCEQIQMDEGSRVL
jgi:hypothetical protein